MTHKHSVKCTSIRFYCGITILYTRTQSSPKQAITDGSHRAPTLLVSTKWVFTHAKVHVSGKVCITGKSEIVHTFGYLPCCDTGNAVTLNTIA
jgi:hypothetical protein